MFYVDTIDPNKTIREGIDAMLYSLDPYTEYYPEDDQSEIGADAEEFLWWYRFCDYLESELKRSMISEPYENMPAAGCSLKAGDILMEIDGKDLAGKNNQEVSENASRTSGYQLQAESATSRYRETVGFRHCAPFHPIAVHTLLYGAG